MAITKITGALNVLFAQNLAVSLNSDAAQNNKYMFGTQRGPLPHLWNITVKHT